MAFNKLLIGKYTYTIDEKGRLFIPAKLREKMGESLMIITDGKLGCLAVYSEDIIVSLYNRLENESRETIISMSDVFMNANEVTPDKQGRITITPEQRKFAGLEEKSDVVIGGMGKFLLIGTPERMARLSGSSVIPDDLGL